jgi:hypothetical protein
MPGVKKKITKEKGHPAWRLPGIGQLLLRCLNSGIHALAMPGKSVRVGRVFRSGLLPERKRIGILADPPAGLSSAPHRRTGAPGKAAGHPGPHSVRSGFAAAKAAVHAASFVPCRSPLAGDAFAGTPAKSDSVAAGDRKLFAFDAEKQSGAFA